MNSYLKSYELTLTCHGPVFIGSGEQRTPKEYVEGRQGIYFPDMQRLYTDIASHGKAKSFEAFVMNTGNGGSAASRLGDWLQRNGIAPSPRLHGGYAVKLGALVPGRERRTANGGITREQHHLNEIHSFTKDAYGNPYVPGSSIKGMLRSIFLQTRLHRLKQPLRVAGADKREQRDFGRRRELELLRKSGRSPRTEDAVNDLFQAIRVADSPSLATSDLLICQKMDMNIRGEVGGLPLFRECLRVGAVIAVRITLDTSPMQHGGWPDGEGFLDTLASDTAYVNDVRYADYAAKYWDDDPRRGPIVYLGGGAGYRSKTFVTHQDDMAKVLDFQFPKIKHLQKTRELGVSPLALKITQVDGKYYEIGICELSIRQTDA